MSEQASWGIPQWTQGDRLRKALDHADVSVGAMAEYLEVSRNTIGNYVHDRTSVPGQTLRLWAMRTGVPREWLETGRSPEQGGPDDGGWAPWDSNPQPTDYGYPLLRVAA